METSVAPPNCSLIASKSTRTVDCGEKLRMYSVPTLMSLADQIATTTPTIATTAICLRCWVSKAASLSAIPANQRTEVARWLRQRHNTSSDGNNSSTKPTVAATPSDDSSANWRTAGSGLISSASKPATVVAPVSSKGGPLRCQVRNTACWGDSLVGASGSKNSDNRCTE